MLTDEPAAVLKEIEMKEIKFRQPRMAKGKFHHWHYWGYVDNSYGHFVSPLPPNTGGESNQFTGRKDDDDVELYEDDICTAGYCCAVSFDSKPHLLTGTIEQESNGLWMFCFGNGTMPLDNEDLCDIIKIGTTYETPELLE